jgi:hypothetical protein
MLFFAPMWATSLEPLTLKDVYAFVVKKPFEGALQEVGILGGISNGVILYSFNASADGQRIIPIWGYRSISFTHVVQQIC